MSYSPTTWANGDTITAAKLNNMESGIEDAQNGWEVTSSTTTYIDNESVATADNGNGFAMGATSYSNAISDSTITVVFDGTTYTCALGSVGYGATAESPVPDFTDYPFGLVPMGPVLLITESAGTYTLSVSVSSSSATTTEDFNLAVATAAADLLPMECVSGTTTYDEMLAAAQAGRIMFFHQYSDVTMFCFITNFDNGIAFIPTDAGVVASFDSDNVFTVTIS